MDEILSFLLLGTLLQRAKDVNKLVGSDDHQHRQKCCSLELGLGGECITSAKLLSLTGPVSSLRKVSSNTCQYYLDFFFLLSRFYFKSTQCQSQN